MPAAPAGAVYRIIVCVKYTPETAPSTGRAPCNNIPAPTDGTGYWPSYVDAYMLDPSAASAFENLSSSDVAAVFSVGFSAVIFCFLLGRCVGVVLSMIRKA